MHSVDFLIIGQGLAGSLLAYTLTKRRKSVLVLDNKHIGSSTKVAAGLINPITGQRLNMTEGFFDYAQSAKKLYWQIERDLGCKIHTPIQQARLIKNSAQAGFLEQRLQQAHYQPLISKFNARELASNSGFKDACLQPYGAIHVEMSGIVDTKQLLFAMHNWLAERQLIHTCKFDYASLATNKAGLIFKSQTLGHVAANQVVFCEGYQAINNPWLKDLPFKLAKGEILTVKTEPSSDRLLSWGNWLAPSMPGISGGTSKLGANYVWDDLSLIPSQTAQNKLLESLSQTTNLKASVTEHEVGIRPTTTQRAPFVGPLSNFDNAYCLNGLGSKGCLIAPHYVQLLCDHLEHNTPLNHELTQWL